MSADRRAALLATIAAAQEELGRLESVPDPADLPGGTVLLWTQTYPPGQPRGLYVPPRDDTTYTFVAFKAPTGHWYTTARHDNQKVMTDGQLRARLASERVGEISIVTAWEQLQ